MDAKVNNNVRNICCVRGIGREALQRLQRPDSARLHDYMRQELMTRATVLCVVRVKRANQVRGGVISHSLKWAETSDLKVEAHRVYVFRGRQRVAVKIEIRLSPRVRSALARPVQTEVHREECAKSTERCERQRRTSPNPSGSQPSPQPNRSVPTTSR